MLVCRGRLLGMHRSGRTSSTSREALNARWCSRVSTAACVGSIVVCTSKVGAGVGLPPAQGGPLGVSTAQWAHCTHKHDKAVMFVVLHDWSTRWLCGG